MQLNAAIRYHLIPTRRLSSLGAGEDVENLEPHTSLVGMQNGVTALGNSLVVPQMVKHTVTIKPSNSTPRHVPNRTENIRAHKILYKNAYTL